MNHLCANLQTVIYRTENHQMNHPSENHQMVIHRHANHRLAKSQNVGFPIEEFRTVHRRHAIRPDAEPPTVPRNHEVQPHGTNQRRDEENGPLA